MRSDSVKYPHTLAVGYDAEAQVLTAHADGMLVHQVRGPLGPFTLHVCVEAVGTEGYFGVTFENLHYLDLDGQGQANVLSLGAWDPHFAPVFISYAHADRGE